MTKAELRRWAGQSRRLRSARIFAIRTAARLAKDGQGAPIFLNSIPKAGTHVLMQALDEMPGIRTAGVHLEKAKVVRGNAEPAERNRDVDWSKVESLLARNARPGRYITAHTWAHQELFDLLADHGYVALFVIRDPRDVVVSQAAYVKRLRRHPDHKRFAHRLTTDQERYRAIIEGYEEDDSGPAGVSLAERLEGFKPWIEHAAVLTCRFEDLIGPSGGGSEEDQVRTLTRIAAAIGLPLDEAAVAEISAAIWSPSSATFNKGRIGAWRKSFDSETVDLFNAQVSGELMARYGYPSDAPTPTSP
jgi:hypothetical protein